MQMLYLGCTVLCLILFVCSYLHFYYKRQYLALKSEFQQKFSDQLFILKQIHETQATVINHLPALRALEGTVLQHEKRLGDFEEMIK